MLKIIRITPILVLFLFVFAAGNCFAQLEDDGMINDFHKSNVGKIIFAGKSIFMNREDKAGITNEFTWGNPIYCMSYFRRGMNNEYKDLGWDYSGATYYLTEVYIGDKLAGSVSQEIDKKWTNIGASYFPHGKDNYDWKEKTILPAALKPLTEGKYTVTVKIYPSNSDGTKKGSIVCEGSFTLNYKPLPEADPTVVNKPEKPVFYSIMTRSSSTPDPKEWVIKMNIGTGIMKTRWTSDDAWNEWLVQLPDYNATVKTRFSGGWNEWFFEDGAEKITIKTRFSGNDGWHEWFINSTKEQYVVKTRWTGSDGWKEWFIESTAGSMSIKTRWSGDDGWKEWTITDNMPAEPTNMKLASIFPCIFSAAFLVR